MEKREEEDIKDVFGGDGDLPDWPAIRPYHIRIMQFQLPDLAEGLPASMVVVLEFDAIPGLSEAVDRQPEGEAFDTVTRWSISHPPESDSPFALLSIYCKQRDLGFHIAINVDQHSEALMVVARTKSVLIIDPEMDRNLRLQNPFEAMKSGRMMDLNVEDAQPILQILLQRQDIPPKTPTADEAPAEDSDERNLAEFLEGARPAKLTSIVMMVDLPPTIVLVDPEVGDLPDRIGPEPGFALGSWTAKAADDGPVIRLECSLEDGSTASWFLTSPSQELMRVAALSTHMVVVADKPIRQGSNRKVLAQMAKGAPIYVDKVNLAMLEFIDNRLPETDTD
jgi:hypothetical protein